MKKLEDMTDQEQYDELSKVFKYLPNYEHHPIQFAWHVRLYKFYKAREAKYGKSLSQEIIKEDHGKSSTGG